MNFQAELQFKPIKTNTYEKERERKREDQGKWAACFDSIVGAYIESRTFERFHKDFNCLNDRLDCFVPSRGEFKCQQFASAGTKETKKEIDSEEEIEEEVKKEEEGEKEIKKKGRRRKFPQNGCGRYWNSNLCLTKFVCRIEGKNKLVVELREYGQRCEHCTKRYENPSFKHRVLELMIRWLLDMIVKGMFGIVDPSLEINPDDMGYFPSRRGRRPAGANKSHDSERCEACIENKGCGLKKIVKKQRKRRNRGGRNTQQQRQQQQ